MNNTKDEHISNLGIINLPPDGEWVRQGVYRTEKHFAWGRQYGKQLLSNPEFSSQTLKDYGAFGSPVYLDLETTGLLYGTKNYAFLVGLGLCEKEYLNVVQLFLAAPKWENDWIEQLELEIPNDNYGLVTYNGADFDLPMLDVRYKLFEMLPKWKTAAHLDLLKLSRHFYRGKFASCSLSSMESNVLGLERSAEDIPGRQIPQLYNRFLLTKDALPLAGIFYHNTLDIVSLAVFQNHIYDILCGKGTGLEQLSAGDLRLMHGDRAEAIKHWKLAEKFENSAVAARMRLKEKTAD